MGSGSSKAEDPRVKFSTPSDLYKTQTWNLKVVKKMIWDRKLAPFFPAVEDDGHAKENVTGHHASSVLDTVEECPVCFLSYAGGLNTALCCRQRVCTECVLQVQAPPGDPPKSCPFCLCHSFQTEYRGPLTQEEVRREREEQEKVSRLQKQIAEEEQERQTMRVLQKTAQIPNVQNIFAKEEQQQQQQPSAQPQPQQQQQQQEGKKKEEEEEEEEERYEEEDESVSAENSEERRMMEEAIRLSLEPQDHHHHHQHAAAVEEREQNNPPEDDEEELVRRAITLSLGGNW